MSVFLFFLCFFFFKQKTAYEMRISDWSSDVCSSDLHPQRRRADGVARDVRAYGCDGYRLWQAAPRDHRRVGVSARDDRAVYEGGDRCRPCLGHDRNLADRDDGQKAVELGRDEL